VQFGVRPAKEMILLLGSLVKINGNQFVLVKVDGGKQTDVAGN
jgi:hypothetical protein